ncbi:hypothetical protein GCM10022255_110590 [Dactylosporangium darangshiense]|uniref:Winged helix-turn helix domain-containing protein n=1 Tax=Dactylosporangium darangshiense TaxID=579108 RepID=A0ABP8DV57_9ACTN
MWRHVERHVNNPTEAHYSQLKHRLRPMRGLRTDRTAQTITLARVAEVIERMTGVRYTLSQTWLILRQRLGWTRKRPARRAVGRDDAAIEAWAKQDWPRIKRGLDDAAPGSASPTKADYRSCPQ